MAFDKSGKYHMNPAHAKMMDGAPPKKGMSTAPEHDGMDEGDGMDGEPDETTEQVHSHLADMHAQHGGKHMHVHSKEDGTHTTHHVDGAGQLHGPHHHQSPEELHAHLDKFFNEEEAEPEEQGEHEPQLSGY